MTGTVRRPRPAVIAGLVALAAAGLVAAVAAWPAWSTPADPADTAWTVARGELVTELIEPGTLRAVRSRSYRSPINGREVEIVYLVPEGLHVGAGTLLARLETREVEADLQRAVDAVHDAELALQVAELELLEATAGLESAVAGEGVLTLDDSRRSLALAERKVDRLRREVANLEPLLEKGFITGDELERSRTELETAEADLESARRRARVLVEQTHPVETRRAELQLAQKRAQRQVVERRLAAAQQQVAAMTALLERCAIYADGPGLVVYEEFIASSPRRKVRPGDRVTPSQGIVRVVEVNRMLVDTSVPERSIHRVRLGQPATVRVEAFPDLRLSGRIAAVGALARTSFDSPSDDKRFDVTVELDPADADLRPEMTARVDIRVGERPDVLLLPVNAVFESDGMTVVTVLRGGRAEPRQVEIGEQNSRFVEVVAGVAGGDRVLIAGDAPAVDAGSPPAGGPTRSIAALEIDVDALRGATGEISMGPAR